MCNVDSLNIPGISHSIFLDCGRRWVTGAEESETAGEGGGPRTAHRRVQLQPCRFPFIVKLSFFFPFNSLLHNRQQNSERSSHFCPKFVDCVE